MGTRSSSRTHKTKRRVSSSKTQGRRKRSQRRLGRTYDSALSLPLAGRRSLADRTGRPGLLAVSDR